MRFFRKIFHFFFPPKKDASMSAIKAALRNSRGSPIDGEGSQVVDDPLTEKDKVWVRGKNS
jgi:hypothetical protein